MHLFNIKPGQMANVRVLKKLDEDFVAPKTQREVAFTGQGTRLGSIVPTLSVIAPSTASAATPDVDSKSKLNVDPSKPTTQIQIRIHDGTRYRDIYCTNYFQSGCSR